MDYYVSGLQPGDKECGDFHISPAQAQQCTDKREGYRTNIGFKPMGLQVIKKQGEGIHYTDYAYRLTHKGISLK